MLQADIYNDREKKYWEATFAKRFRKMAAIGLIAKWQPALGYGHTDKTLTGREIATMNGWRIHIEWKADGPGKRRKWYETFGPSQFDLWYSGFISHERAKDPEKTIASIFREWTP